MYRFCELFNSLRLVPGRLVRGLDSQRLHALDGSEIRWCGAHLTNVMLCTWSPKNHAKMGLWETPRFSKGLNEGAGYMHSVYTQNHAWITPWTKSPHGPNHLMDQITSETRLLVWRFLRKIAPLLATRRECFRV
jgi:hypothetical protein